MFPQRLSSALVLAFLGALAFRVSANVRPECVEEERINSGDTCASIAAGDGITPAQLEALNPGVNCSVSLAPLVGHYLCLRSYAAPCTHEVAVSSTDTCSSLAAAYQTSVATLIQLNDNLDAACDNLVAGGQYCVSIDFCYYGNDNTCCTPVGGPDCP